MEQYVIDQIKYGLKYVPINILKSFIPRNNADVDAFRKSAGGFICGVCHPRENYEQIMAANIGWIRIDIPVPFEANGTPNQAYLEFKERCRGYAERGIKIMAVTPYPYQYMDKGIDPRVQEDVILDSVRFLAIDLQGLAHAFQVTNEMGIPRFTIPFTMDEAAHYIGTQLQALQDVKGDILVGYNSAGPQADLHIRMKPYFQYCDYVGIDIYIGCFAGLGGFLWFYDAMLRYLRAFTGKPILLEEFGYIGAGKAKTKVQKAEILKRYGVSSEKEAYANIRSFMNNLPEGMAAHLRHLSPDENHLGDLIFKSDFRNHLYCELPKTTMIPGMPHTPAGQAKFFNKLLPRLYKMPFMGGAIIYCYSDSDSCYVCTQADCPTETKWGLVDRNEKEKPAYYAVQRAFGRIKQSEHAKK